MRQQQLQRRFRRIWGHALSLSTIFTLVIMPATVAAERIQFFVGPFQPTIWVNDLEAFAKDGTVTDRFRLFAQNLSPEQLQELREFLNLNLDVDLITMSQTTYWQVGERFLDRMGQVIQTDGFLNGSRALRAALIFSAQDGNGVTPLEVLQNFPLKTIQLDFVLMRQLILENRRFFVGRDQIVAELRATGDREAAQFFPAVRANPSEPGNLQWQQETLTLQNPLRSGDIPFDVYLPQTGSSEAKIPIVVLSHGVASSRNTFAYLAKHLASHGYAVVVPQHDDDSRKYEQFLAGVDRPPNPITLVSRPRDISLALDELERQAKTRQDYAKLDLNNVGLIGHSLGGFTVLAAAGAEFNFEKLQKNCPLENRDRPSLNPSLLVQCDLLDLFAGAPFKLRDERIRAVMAINPLTSLFFGEAGLGQITIPTLFVAATADTIVPAIPEQIEPYRWLKTDYRYLVVAENVTHFSFVEGSLEEGALPLPSSLLGPDPQKARPYLKAVSLSFFNRHLLLQSDAEAFLTQPNLDLLGTKPFRLAIVRNLAP